MPRQPGDTVDVTESTTPERELKYSLPRSAVPSASSLLGVICRRDLEHPAGVVSSIYYDTNDWASLGEKVNSDYLKTKVRLRWYRRVQDRTPQPGVFLEAKIKIGAQRTKVRYEIPLRAEHVETLSLDGAELSTIPGELRRRGLPVPLSMSPVLLVSYRRERYVEALTRARVALDTDLAVEKVSRRVPAVWPHVLSNAVVEVKGAVDVLPRSLAGLLRLDCRRVSFCKYEAAYLGATRRER